MATDKSNLSLEQVGCFCAGFSLYVCFFFIFDTSTKSNIKLFPHPYDHDSDSFYKYNPTVRILGTVTEGITLFFVSKLYIYRSQNNDAASNIILYLQEQIFLHIFSDIFVVTPAGSFLECHQQMYETLYIIYAELYRTNSSLCFMMHV